MGRVGGMKQEFEWNRSKSEENLRKHGVSFEEASSVFLDPLSIMAPDPRHWLDEPRFNIVGLSDQSRILIVVYTERGGTIRIISCRKAASAERKRYEET